MNSILGYINGFPVFETRATAHDPHSGQFTSGGGSSSLSSIASKKLMAPHLAEIKQIKKWTTDVGKISLPAHEASVTAWKSGKHSDHKLAKDAHEGAASKFAQAGNAHALAKAHSKWAAEHAKYTK